jgi:phospholipid/cholesterol/gamma-HCH transport system substrate-binding protein
LTEFRVGLFTLAALVAFGIAALKITANKAMFGNYTPYRAIVRDATGIFPRTAIKVAGINAGTITEIKLHGDAAMLEFEMRQDLKLTKNSFMRVKTIGFLGEKYIDIVVGEPSEVYLRSNDLIRVVGGAGIEDLAKDAGEIMLEVKQIVAKIREGISNEVNPNVVREILENTNRAIESLKNIVTKNEDRLNDIISNVNQITGQLASETNPENKDSLMAALKKVGPILDEIQLASTDLKIIVADVKAGKGTVGKLLRDEQVVDKVNETLSGVNKLVGRINNLQADIAVYSGYNNKYQSTTELNVDLYTSPERFFRAGIAMNDFRFVEDETETTTSGSENKFTRTKTVNKDKYKFSLQLGRRFHDWQFRVGLIETRGGMGVDYDITSLNTRLSAELFDFGRDDHPANLRVSSEMRIWNVLYSKLSVEDLLGSRISYTIYGGLKFTDDDLASLIGLVAR